MPRLDRGIHSGRGTGGAGKRSSMQAQIPRHEENAHAQEKQRRVDEYLKKHINLQTSLVSCRKHPRCSEYRPLWQRFPALSRRYCAVLSPRPVTHRVSRLCGQAAQVSVSGHPWTKYFPFPTARCRDWPPGTRRR